MSYSSEVLADSPVSYWRLGEPSGTTAADQQSANAGAYTGSPTLGAAGALAGDSNTAVSLNGSSQYVQVPFSAALNPVSPFTIEAWAFPTGGAGNFRSVVTSRGNGLGFILYLGDDNKWQAWLGVTSGANFGPWFKITGPTGTLNAWSHLVFTYASPTLSLYVNAGAPTTGSNGNFTRNVAFPLRIGAGSTETTPSLFFPGAIDEVAFYPTALNATRIAAHYNAALTVIDSAPAGGAAAGGVVPSASAVTPQGGGVAHGNTPAPAAALTIGGGLAGGMAPGPRAAAGQGAAAANGVGPRVFVPLVTQGALAGGYAPSEDITSADFTFQGVEGVGVGREGPQGTGTSVDNDGLPGAGGRSEGRSEPGRRIVEVS